jgi:drug/metabolite transporter (DMT)-like permease
MSPRKRATLTGFLAVLLWSGLAALTVATAPVPPCLLNALTFAIGGAIGLGWIFARGQAGQVLSLGWRVHLFGTAGLFCYHALYFTALRLAPAAEASLVCYLWPLFIVLAAALTPGARPGPGTYAGAGLAFAGAALVLLGGGGGEGPNGGLGAGALAGLGLAFLAAIVWAGYSAGSRRFGDAPVGAVAIYCLATAVLSSGLHLMLEPTVWPADGAGWAAVVALGLGPVGLAFYFWDEGMKRGDMEFLGVASYAAPLLSTIVLILIGRAEASGALVGAAVLIALGAWLAARDGALRRASSGG